MSKTVALENRKLDSNNKFFEAACSNCEDKVTHQILEAIDTIWIEGDSSGWESYQIIQCQGCKTLSFCKESQLAEFKDIKPDTGETFYPRFWDFYPDKGDAKNSLTLSHKLPVIVEEIYDEIIHAFNARLFVVASLGIKAMIEGVCRNKRILKGAPLSFKIEGLVDAGHITADGAKILHSLTDMGSKPTFEIMKLDARELRAAIEVIDHLIRGTYLIPELAKEVAPAA